MPDVSSVPGPAPSAGGTDGELLPPDRQPPEPLSQSVAAGQDAVYVTAAVQGQGHGSPSQAVTLQVLGPDPGLLRQLW